MRHWNIQKSPPFFFFYTFNAQTQYEADSKFVILLYESYSVLYTNYVGVPAEF